MTEAVSRQKRRYLTIGEVSKITGLEQHVLRYWEKEFGDINPRRVAGRRLYRPDDVKQIELIRDLLYKQGFTIAGAKKKLREIKSGGSSSHVNSTDRSASDVLRQIRQELIELRLFLNDNKD